jgi:hypothetical protein
MNNLRDFFDDERKKVFKPDSFFAQRVMARLNDQLSQNPRESGIWDAVPGSTRPVLALALTLILCFIAVAMLVPQMPQRGIVESFLAPDQNAAENFLYNDTDVPSRPIVLQQLISPEEQQ